MAQDQDRIAQILMPNPQTISSGAPDAASQVGAMFNKTAQTPPAEDQGNAQQQMLKEDYFKKFGVDQPPQVPTTNSEGLTIPQLHTKAKVHLENARQGYLKELQNAPPEQRHARGSMAIALGSLIAGALGDKMHQSSAGMNFQKEKLAQTQQRLNDEYTKATHKFNTAREIAFAKSQFENEDANQAMKDIEDIKGEGAAVNADWLKKLNIASVLTGKQDSDQTKMETAQLSKFAKDWNGAVQLYKGGQSAEQRLVGLGLMRRFYMQHPDMVAQLGNPIGLDDVRDSYEDPKKLPLDIQKLLDPSMAAATPKENQQAAQAGLINAKTNQTNQMTPVNVAKGNSVADVNNAKVGQVITQQGLNEARTEMIDAQRKQLPDKLNIAWFNAKTARDRAEAAIAKGRTGRGSDGWKAAKVSYDEAQKFENGLISQRDKVAKLWTANQKQAKEGRIDPDLELKRKLDNLNEQLNGKRVFVGPGIPTHIPGAKENTEDAYNLLQESLKPAPAKLTGQIKNPHKSTKSKKTAMNGNKPFNPFDLLNNADISSE